jgi:hypothetical protein
MMLRSVFSISLTETGRLFDHDGEIRKTICQDFTADADDDDDVHFLEEMKSDFYDTFGSNEKYVICMFSHYLPCTDPEHLCSRVLCEFATQHNEQLYAFEIF